MGVVTMPCHGEDQQKTVSIQSIHMVIKTCDYLIALTSPYTMYHRRSHSPETYVRKPWLIVMVKLGYSFNVHASLPLCVVISQHCEEPGCSFQTLEGRSPIGYYVATFNVLTYKLYSGTLFERPPF